MNCNQEFAVDHNHNLNLEEKTIIGLGILPQNMLNSEQTNPHELTLEQTHEFLGYTHNHDLALSHGDNHKQVLGNTRKLDESLLHDNEMDLPRSHGYNCEHEDGGLHDNLFSLGAETYEFGLEHNHDITVMEDQEPDQSVELVVHNNQEMEFGSSQDIEIQDSHLAFTPNSDSGEVVASVGDELTVGRQFPDDETCKRVLKDIAIAHRFEMRIVKSSKSKFTAKCVNEGCPWRVHAAKVSGGSAFTIRTVNDVHTCAGVTHLGHRQASVKWVADTVKQRFRENPDLTPKDIMEEIRRVHGVTLCYKQVWRGKERVMEALRVSLEDGYRLLPQYCDQLRRTNPGSIAAVYGSPIDNCFQRLFISFQASISGFVHACLPLLGLHRTPLKSKYLGTLLYATGFDGNGTLFPLAFGVVDDENNDSWMWFLSELRNLFEINTWNVPRLTILSDRQKSKMEAVEANFPHAFHSFCICCLSDNFCKEFNDNMLVDLLKEAANAPTVLEFNSKIEEIKKISQKAAEWIHRIEPHFWETAYIEGTMYGDLTANITESLDPWIVEVSGLPILEMMESIRRQLMNWFNERHEASMQWDTMLVPAAERQVSEALKCACSYQVQHTNEAKYNVISHTGTYIVDIQKHWCACRGWQLFGLPCSHAVAVLQSCEQNVHYFADSCFTVATYREAYSQVIHPVPDKRLWKDLAEENQNEGTDTAEIVINPPKSLPPPGQPRKRRVQKEGGRGKRTVHCSRCNQAGHFRTTCYAPI